MDIYDVGLSADASRVIPGVRALDKLVASAANAEDHVESLSSSTKSLGNVMGRFRAMTDTATTSLTRFVGKSGGAIGGMRGLGFQLNQVAQVGAMTGNWLEAMAIQMPDILLGFGTLGIFAGIAAAALIPMAQSLANMSDYAGRYDEAQKQLNDTLSAFKSIVESATTSNSDLAKIYGEDLEKARVILIKQGERLGRETSQAISKSLQEAFDGLGEGSSLYETLGLSDIRIKNRQNVQSLGRDIENLGKNTNIDVMDKALTNVLNKFKELASESGIINPDELKFINQVEEALLSVYEVKKQTNNLNTPLPAFSGDDLFWEQLDTFNKDLSTSIGMIKDFEDAIKLSDMELEFGGDSREHLQAQLDIEKRIFEERIRGLEVLDTTKNRLRELFELSQISAKMRFDANQDKKNLEDQELLANMQQRLQAQIMLNRHGKDSVQYTDARNRMERAALVTQLERRDVENSLKKEILSTFDTMKQIEKVDIAGALEIASNWADRMSDKFSGFLDKSRDTYKEFKGMSDSLKSQLEIQRALSLYGSDSLRYVNLKNEAERNALITKMDQRHVHGELRDVILQTFDSLKQAEQIDLASVAKSAATWYERIKDHVNDAIEKQTENTLKAEEILVNLRDQLAIHQALSRYGRESVQYRQAVIDSERAALEAELDRLSVHKELRDEILASFDVLKQIEQIDIASGIQAAAGWAKSLYENLANALSAFGELANKSITDSRQRQDLAEARLRTVGNPVARAGEEAVINYRYEANDQLGLARGDSMDNLTGIEQKVKSAAEATASAELAAREADKAYNKLLRGNSSGGGGKSDLERELERLKREGERVYMDTRTAAELYAIEVEKLNLLHKVGAIDLDTYSRAMKDVEKEYGSITDVQKLIEGNQGTFVSGLTEGVFAAQSMSEAMEQVARRVAEAALEARLLQSLFNTGPWAVEGGSGLLSGLGGFLGKAFSGISGVPQNATGTTDFPGGWTRMNEYGGELAYLPDGSKIIPADQSANIVKNPTINMAVQINNSASDLVDVTAEQGPNGAPKINVVKKMLKGLVDTGSLDGVMKKRYNMKPNPSR